MAKTAKEYEKIVNRKKVRKVYGTNQKFKNYYPENKIRSWVSLFTSDAYSIYASKRDIIAH